ncbi:hypothetical protein B0H14DRAFT_3011705 [Mycena olivaceomarginata]|nr:hypothetical protein B0H14DRAFT_3011705 [Mycena olivaceomarginata]
MPQSPEPYDTPLVTGFKRACDAANDHGRRRRGDHAPASGPRSSTHHLLLDPGETKTETRPHHRPEFADPASYRWPAPILPPPPPPLSPPPTRVVNARGVDITSSPDARWYHFVFLVVAWHVLIALFSVYLILRVVFKPLVCVVVLYYAISVGQLLYSFL